MVSVNMKSDIMNMVFVAIFLYENDYQFKISFKNILIWYKVRIPQEPREIEHLMAFSISTVFINTY